MHNGQQDLFSILNAGCLTDSQTGDTGEQRDKVTGDQDEQGDKMTGDEAIGGKQQQRYK